MQARGMSMAVMMAVVLGLAGCATAPPTLQFEKGTIDPATVVPRVEEFVIVVDGSLSMADPSRRQPKLEIARELAAAMAVTAPAVRYRGGLRTFGQGPCLDDAATSILYGMDRYFPEQAAAAAGRVICSGGPSPLDAALEAVGRDLSPDTRKAAVIFLSDGLHMGGAELDAARALRAKVGDGLCLYPVQVGEATAGRTLLAELARIGGCGEVVPAAELADPERLASFVYHALLEADTDGDGVPDRLDRCPGTPRGTPVDDVGCPLDTDGDGVADGRDRCPDTPRGVKVDANGCPLDTDGDGVPDGRDRCPDTPKGVAVDEVGCPLVTDSDGDGVPDTGDRCPGTPRGTPVDDRGCPVQGVTMAGSEWHVAGDVLFDFDRAEIRADAAATLDGIAEHLKRSPDLKLVIEGHTDDVGTDEYNLDLGQRRADAAKAALVARGIAAERLWAASRGEAEPVAPNDSADNRALNRRVEFIPQQ